MAEDTSLKKSNDKVESKEKELNLPEFIKEKQESIAKLNNRGAVSAVVPGVAEEYGVSEQYLLKLIYPKA